MMKKLYGQVPPGKGIKMQRKRSLYPQEATLVTGFNGSITLRTIPVYLKNGNKKLRVNTPLYDASKKATSMLVSQIKWVYKGNWKKLM